MYGLAITFENQVKTVLLVAASAAARFKQAHALRCWRRVASNHSLKLSANGVSRWPSGAGASPHFAPAVQRATPLSPA